MKKKLKYLIPLGVIAVLTVVLLCALLPKYLGLGEVVLEGIFRPYSGTGDSCAVVQVRETGSRMYRLGELTADPVFSPNGRYVAVQTKVEGESVTELYDLKSPKKPLISVTGYLHTVLPTDGGLLLYRGISKELYCHDGTQAHEIDTDIAYGAMQALENTVYYFRNAGTEEAAIYDLYACTLPDGTPRLLGEDLHPQSLQVCLWEGRHYVLAARRYTMTGTRYDQVNDDAGEEKSELRTQLKAIAFNEQVCNLYRWADGEMIVLAEGIVGDYRAEPVSGTVVCRISAFLIPQWDLSAMEEAIFRASGIWYCIQSGKTSEFVRGTTIDPVITPKGEIFLKKGSELLHWSAPHAEQEHLLTYVNNFRVLVDESGTAEVYILTGARTLKALRDGAELTLAASVSVASLPAMALPGGAYQKTNDAVFYARRNDEALREPGPVTMWQYAATLWPSTVFCKWMDGVETKLLTGRYLDDATAVTRDGSAVIDTSSGFWIVGDDRSEMFLSGHLFFPPQKQVVTLSFHDSAHPSDTALA